MEKKIVKIVGPHVDTAGIAVGEKLVVRLNAYPKDKFAIKLETTSGDEVGYVAARPETAGEYPIAKDVFSFVKEGDVVEVTNDNPYCISIPVNEKVKVKENKLVTNEYCLVMGGNKMQFPNRMKVISALRKAKKLDLVYEVRESDIIFSYEGVPCGNTTSENTPTAKATLEQKGLKIAEFADVVKAISSAKEVKVESEFLDGIIIPVKFTIVTEAENAPVAVSVSKDYLEAFEKDDSKEVHKRVSWLKANNVAEYAIALFIDMIKAHKGISAFEPCYIPQGKEIENAIAFSHGTDNRGNLLLVGPAGSGKNMFILTFANLMDLQLIDKTCSAGVDEEALFGYLSMKASDDRPDNEAINIAFKKFIKNMGLSSVQKSDFAKLSVEEQIAFIEKTMHDDCDYSVLFNAMRDNAQIQFEPSVLTKSLEIPTLINLDEVNTLRPTVTSALHSALDKRRNILVNGYKNVGINQDVIFTATMNEGQEYGGTSTLNLAFEDRWHILEFEAPDDIVSILKQEVPALNNNAIKVLNNLYKKMKAIRGVDISERSFSQRAFIYCAINISLGNNIKDAIMATIIPKIRDVEDREAIKSMVDLMIK